MAGVVNRAVAADGVIAFQDRENPEKFEYFPSRVQGVLGETLESFLCQYYGIGDKPQWAQTGSGTYLNVVGGLVEGTAVFDASSAQKEALREEIRKLYRIEDPTLTPVTLKDVTTQPVFVQGLAELGGGSKSSFPDSVYLGESFRFLVYSGNSLFPQLIASLTRATDGGSVLSPTIGMNVKGKLEVYGKPFKATLKADLKQVWEYTRDQVSTDADFGWFNFGDGFGSIARELHEKNVVEMEILEGRADPEFGLQLLESTKVVFEAVNDLITTGEGMFRFEPNPNPRQPTDPQNIWPASLAPWTVAVNLSFIRDSFDRPHYFEETVSFQDVYTIDVHSFMDLGVVCGPETRHMFKDVTKNEYGCITRKKMDTFRRRVVKEVRAKERKLKEYTRKLLSGKIDLATFEVLVAMLNNRTLTEQHTDDRRRADDLIREVEEYAERRLGIRIAA